MEKYLMRKAIELVASLENVKSFELIFEFAPREENYSSDLLVVCLKNGTCKLYLYNRTREQFEFYK